MNLKTKITKIHYDKNAKGIFYSLLGVCSVFYAAGAGFKNFLYDKGVLKSYKVNAKVISVGNLTTGGVGKTPVVAGIAKYLISKGEKVCILSRGYGGELSNKNVNIISDGVNLYHNAKEAGDEPYWLAVNLDGCAVITCKDRVKAAQYALEKFGVTHIILDDGFQYRRLARDINLLLVDSEKMFGNEKLLPQGPLREGVEGVKRVNRVLVVSKNTEHSRAEKYTRVLSKKLNIPALLCKTEPEYIYNIKSGEHLDKGVDITAISAIGQPEQFYKFLEKDFNIIKTITFDDHHPYTKSDIENVKGIIVTTEKDAVKLAKYDKNNIFALKLKTEFNVQELLIEHAEKKQN